MYFQTCFSMLKLLNRFNSSINSWKARKKKKEDFKPVKISARKDKIDDWKGLKIASPRDDLNIINRLLTFNKTFYLCVQLALSRHWLKATVQEKWSSTFCMDGKNNTALTLQSI